jgi:hypothetical protein
MPLWMGWVPQKATPSPSLTMAGKEAGRQSSQTVQKKHLANILNYMLLLLTCFLQMSFLADMLACWPELVNNLEQEVLKLWPELGAGASVLATWPGTSCQWFFEGAQHLLFIGRWYQFLYKTTDVEQDVQFPFLLAHEFSQHLLDKMGDRI